MAISTRTQMSLAGGAVALLTEAATLKYTGSIPHDRDPQDKVYRYDDSIYEKSITMRGWMDITKLRGRNYNNGKIVAELGYISNSVFGILETVGRGLAWGIVCNPLSSAIAGCITEGSPQKQAEYEKVAKFMKDSTAITFEATLQNAASIITNPFSHDLNLALAEDVKGSIISPSAMSTDYYHYRTRC